MNRTILIVDDDHEFRRLLSLSLRTRWKVITASNGKEALEVFKSHSVDLLLSDVQMPELDGIGLLKAVRSSLQVRPSVVIMSGACDYTPEEILRLGADAFLAKPFTSEALLNQLQRLLRASA